MQLTASAEGGSAVVRISDSGIGIPEQEQGELFSRFYRASNARAQAIPGTGLGLPIVRTIVANHNGEVQLQSQQDAGTVVTVRLPLLAARGWPALRRVRPLAGPLSAGLPRHCPWRPEQVSRDSMTGTRHRPERVPGRPASASPAMM